MKSSLAALLVLVLAACNGAVEPGGTTPAPTGSSGSTATSASGGESTVATPGEGTLTCWSSPAQGGGGSISFADETEAYGLVSPLIGMHGHAAVWADFDQDHRLDLFVGTFAHRDVEHYQFRGAQGPSPDRLVRGGEGEFVVDQALPEMHTRTSGGAAGDFDGDGDLDLVVSRNYDDDRPEAPATQVLRNDDGSLVPIEGTGLPVEFGGRSVGVLDYDGDGLLDLYIVEDRWSGGQSALFRNVGGLQFEDVTQQAALPLDAHGLGVAVADLTGNGYQDIFVAGSNRLFVAVGDGTFREADGSVFGWQFFDDEDDVAGVSVADVNRDGTLEVEGRTFGFDEALELGLVNKIFEAEGFLDAVLEYAANFVPPKAASRAVGRIKRAVCSGVEVPFSEGLAIERELQQLLFQGDDAREGLAAYIEKRSPEFTGS